MSSSTPSVPPADTKTPREVGREMARLRGQFGMTPHEVSERIHIRPRYITAMEEGKLEQLPGKVYARGYLHTYAEFLGMSADRVIEQCFGNEAAHSAPASLGPSADFRVSNYGPASGQWRVYGVLTVIVLGALLVYHQMNGARNADESALSTVMPVPELMLASMRNVVMPTPANYDCLTGGTFLACTYSDAASRLLARAATHTMPNREHIDVTGYAVLPPSLTQESAISEQEAAELTPPVRRPRVRKRVPSEDSEPETIAEESVNE